MFMRLLKNKPNVSSNRELVVRDKLQSVAMEMVLRDLTLSRGLGRECLWQSCRMPGPCL